IPDSLTGVWEGTDGGTVKLRLELCQHGRELKGRGLLTTIDTNEEFQCNASGSTSNGELTVRLLSQALVLDLAGGLIASRRIWIESTGQGEVEKPIAFILDRTSEEPRQGSVDVSSGLWHPFTGRWQ